MKSKKVANLRIHCCHSAKKNKKEYIVVH